MVDQPAPSGARIADAARPTEVTAAGVLLLLLPLIGVVSLVSALVGLIVAEDNGARVAEELASRGYDDAQRLVDGLLSTMWFQVGLATVVKLVQAVGLGVLAFFILRGSPGGRIAVYVVAALSIVGAACLGILDGVRRGVRESLDSFAPGVEVVFVDETDLLPGWYQPINYAALGASVVMIFAVVWLLTRPAANEYFRRGRPDPTPPPQATTVLRGPVPPQPPVLAPGPPPPRQSAPTVPPDKWYKRRPAKVLGAVLVLAVLVFCGISNLRPPPNDSDPASQAEPAHRVTYQVSTVGTANDSLNIRYTSESGELLPDEPPGFAMTWSKEITTAPGGTHVGLHASGASSDLAFTITCMVLVDGRLAATETGKICSLVVDLRAARLSPGPLPPSTPPPSTPAAASTSVAKRPAPVACRYVTTTEATTILFGQIARNTANVTVKPVLAMAGDARKCTYTFDFQASYVTFSWERGGKAKTYWGTRVPGLGAGVRAFWMDYGFYGSLEVQLPNGLFTVYPHFQALPVDKKAFSIELFKTARPRLPKG